MLVHHTSWFAELKKKREQYKCHFILLFVAIESNIASIMEIDTICDWVAGRAVCPPFSLYEFFVSVVRLYATWKTARRSISQCILTHKKDIIANTNVLFASYFETCCCCHDMNSCSTPTYISVVRTDVPCRRWNTLFCLGQR